MLVVHTTGRGLPTKATKRNEYPTITAVNYYSGSRGCHYVNGFRGNEGGDLLQMASENEQAYGVGSGDQAKSIRAGRWEKDLPASLVKRWKDRWPGYSNPLDLLPSTKTVNPCALHVECIPLTPDWEKQGYERHGGTLFTEDQHLTVVRLACDIAKRNGWKGEWWRTPRLLGHEDLTPINRHDKRGGWDPGHLRAAPYFDWELVIKELVRVHYPRFTNTRQSSLADQTKEIRPDDKKPGHYGKY